MWKKGTQALSALGRPNTRSFSKTQSAFGQALVYSKFGTPADVLKLEEYTAPKGQAKDSVLVKMLSAPVNHQDILRIKGTFGAPPSKFPVIGGSEGVGIVADPGSSSLKRGDWVIPKTPEQGTWKTEGVYSASDLLTVRKDIPEEIASVLSVGPATALRLLNDFAQLEEGDVIIQTGGSSLIAQTVMQLAKKRGIKVISVIRNRDEFGYANLVERMKYHGAYIVIRDDFLHHHLFDELISDLPAPKLALDSVGGKTGLNVLRRLGEGGTFVTYGQSSGRPLFAPASSLIFKDIRLRSFDFNQWLSTQSHSQLQETLNYFADLVAKEELGFWVESHDLQDYKNALEEMQWPHDRKLVLKLYDA